MNNTLLCILCVISVFLVLGLVFKHKILEKFTTAMVTSVPIVKSFGTTLINNPHVAEISNTFRFHGVKYKRDLSKVLSFPANSLTDPRWKKYKTYLYDIGNQQNCGGCWAWSSAGALSDRFCLLSGGKIKPRLSAAKLIMCTFHYEKVDVKKMRNFWIHMKRTKHKETHATIACNGNDLYSTGNVLFAFGTTTESCIPYNTINIKADKLKYNLGLSNDPDNIPYCFELMGNSFDVCADGKNAARIYRANDVYKISNNVEDIKQEIYRWGPIISGFIVYEEFISSYDGKSIYMGPKKDEKSAGGHAIRIVGWGEEDNVKFWWIANSWGTDWGMNGYFRMKQSIPECQLEDNMLAVKPQFPGMTLWPLTLDEITPQAKMFRDNPYHHLDPELLYYNDSIKAIKEGKLKGDLKPIIKLEELPNKGDFSKFWIADLL